MTSEVNTCSFQKLKTILQDKGYNLKAIRGTHVMFRNREGKGLVFPVKQGRVKKIFINLIKS